MQRVLGLDTGTNSLGWAVVDRNANEQGDYALIDKGVVIFEEGVNIEKGKESSKAADRTAHQALRTHYFRRRWRKVETLKVLIAHQLCPVLSDEDLHRWRTKKIYPLTKDFMACIIGKTKCEFWSKRRVIWRVKTKSSSNFRLTPIFFSINLED